MDLVVTCQAHATVTQATLENPACTLPTPRPDEKFPTLGEVQFQAARLDLTSLDATDLRLNLNAPAAWLLDWARLLTPGIPPGEAAAGSLQGTLTQQPATPKQAAFWAGTLQGSLSGTAPWHKPEEGVSKYDFVLTGSPSGLDLAPVNLASDDESPLALSGEADATGYKLHVLGTAPASDVQALAAKLPPLAVGLDNVLPPPDGAHAIPQHIDLTCTRVWSSPAQTCTAGHTTEQPAHQYISQRRAHRR